MKKLFGYLAVIAILVLPTLSFALEFRTGEQPSVRVNEKITKDMYIAGGSVTSAGNIEGDLVAGGGNIIVSGDVGADVLAGGGNVTILSNVGDDVRVGAGNLILQGKVGGDVIAGGGQITIGGGGVSGDVAIGGGNIRIDAPVGGKVSIVGDSVYINAPISGDIKIKAERVTLGSAAVISGSLTYGAKKELVMEVGAIVNGKIIFEPIEKNIKGASFAAIFSAFLLWKFFAFLACAMVIGLMFRRFSREMINLATSSPFLELGRGLIILAAMPFISILLFVTLVGIPLGILGLIGFIAMILFSCLLTPIVIGSVVYRYFSKKNLEVSWKTILLGVFIYVVLGYLPFIGWFAQFILMLITLGSIASLKWQMLKEWR